ncbi:MAG: hypothetical protein KatS3mg129_3267 [Leptospiraceae bacterium]|nr:MAG: hypothetical protein KatS3mg129_0688 [Leptospiraceae bacterium]GIX43534.1 MAG: hypothetical protein KatS3mg129_3267 [Leptospiraceae bacterium]
MLLPIGQQLIYFILMIYHKDYVIKLIQQFIVFLAKVFKLKSNEDPEVLLIEIEKAYALFLGYPKEVLLKLDLNSLIHLFSIHNYFQYERLGILGILLLEEADIYKNLNSPEEAQLLKKKGIELLDFCIDNIEDKEFKTIIKKNLEDAKQ